MLARVQLALAAALAVVAAALIVALLLGRSGGGSAARLEVGATGWAGAVRPLTPPGDFTLRDQDGRSVRLAAYRGRPVLLAFLYSTCQDTCPLTAQTIRTALNDLGDVRPAPAVLAVSVDPEQDTPLRARRFVNEQGLTGRMRYLLGDRRQLAAVWRAYGIQPQSLTGDRRSDDHSASTVLLDGAGRQRVGFSTMQTTPEALVHDVRRVAGL